MLRLQLAAVLLGLVSIAAVPALVVYPAKGQSADRQAKDRAACDRWAANETGFDPAVASPPPQKKRTAVKGGLGGAAGGALIGSLSGDAGKGAVIGGVLGAATGGIVEHKQNAKANEIQDENLIGYNRAVAACLTGRGYTVR